MATTRVPTTEIFGIDGRLTEMQAAEAPGVPRIAVDGVPLARWREARCRATSAIRTCGYAATERRLVVSGDVVSGVKPSHDLAFAMAVLAADDQAVVPSETAYYAELGLDGTLRPVAGALVAAEAARDGGMTAIVVAVENYAEAAMAEGIEILGARDLRDVVDGEWAEPTKPVEAQGYHKRPDMRDIRGMETAKRGGEIAAAGGHSLLMVGPPGCGKTLLARAMPGILPAMTRGEAREVARIHSVANFEARVSRPFRAPHHTVSATALMGGGAFPRPGEVSLAHNGVLFLDEFVEFGASTLDALKPVLDEHVARVTRRYWTVTFPAKLLLLGASSPCPCGWRGSDERVCKCGAERVAAYNARLGQRAGMFGMRVTLEAAERNAADVEGETSATIRGRVTKAREIQIARQGKLNAELNADELLLHAPLSGVARAYLGQRARARGLRGDDHSKIVRLARTIADLGGSAKVSWSHIGAAVEYVAGV